MKATTTRASHKVPYPSAYQHSLEFISQVRKPRLISSRMFHLAIIHLPTLLTTLFVLSTLSVAANVSLVNNFRDVLASKHAHQNQTCPRTLTFVFECNCYFNRQGRIEIEDFNVDACIERKRLSGQTRCFDGRLLAIARGHLLLLLDTSNSGN